RCVSCAAHTPCKRTDSRRWPVRDVRRSAGPRLSARVVLQAHSESPRGSTAPRTLDLRTTAGLLPPQREAEATTGLVSRLQSRISHRRWRFGDRNRGNNAPPPAPWTPHSRSGQDRAVAGIRPCCELACALQTSSAAGPLPVRGLAPDRVQ